jgi:hypothetical protein
MSDTPETDAEEDASHNFAELVVPSSLSRRLERALTEAREKAAQWERIALRADTERAEAIKQSAKLRDIADGCLIALERATKYLPEYSRINYEDALWRLRKKLEEETK